MAAIVVPHPGQHSSRRAYAALGGALGLGAPLGLLAARGLARKIREERSWSRWLAGEVRREALTYGYVAFATTAVLALAGRFLGRREDVRQQRQREAQRQEDEFAALVAHDLRDPIAALLARSGALLRKARGGDVQVPVEALQQIQRAGWRLERLVADFLDASEIEHGHLHLEKRLVDLAAELDRVAGRMGPELGSHPLVLNAETVPAISADPQRVEQILGNLLENAAKFSSAETPIEVRIEPEEGGVCVSVRDRGVGIPAEELPRLFDRTYQARRAREAKTGLGLGLYVTKGLVEAHGGSVEVESAPGQGSTFKVWLPATV